jgi:hypothetical protein
MEKGAGKGKGKGKWMKKNKLPEEPKEVVDVAPGKYYGRIKAIEPNPKNPCRQCFIVNRLISGQFGFKDKDWPLPKHKLESIPISGSNTPRDALVEFRLESYDGKQYWPVEITLCFSDIKGKEIMSVPGRDGTAGVAPRFEDASSDTQLELEDYVTKLADSELFTQATYPNGLVPSFEQRKAIIYREAYKYSDTTLSKSEGLKAIGLGALVSQADYDAENCRNRMSRELERLSRGEEAEMEVEGLEGTADKSRQQEASDFVTKALANASKKSAHSQQMPKGFLSHKDLVDANNPFANNRNASESPYASSSLSSALSAQAKDDIHTHSFQKSVSNGSTLNMRDPLSGFATPNDSEEHDLLAKSISSNVSMTKSNSHLNGISPLNRTLSAKLESPQTVKNTGRNVSMEPISYQ